MARPQALNPIGYVSTSLAITAAVKLATAALLHLEGNNSFWSSLGAATLPYAYYGLLGALRPWALPIFLTIIVGPSVLFLFALANGLCGLHSASRARAALALVVALAASAMMLGALHKVFYFTLGVPHFDCYLVRGVPLIGIWY